MGTVRTADPPGAAGVTGQDTGADTDAHPIVLRGLAAGSGCAVGPVRQVRTTVELPKDEPCCEDVDETARSITAIFDSIATDLLARAERVEGEARSVLEATAMIARDSTLAASVRRHLANFGPATAVDRAVREVVSTLAEVGDYWSERATDLLDIRDRAVARWRHVPEPGLPPLERPTVLVARDLAPADAALLDPELVLAIVLQEGGPTAHTAIVAAQLGIPCVVRVAEAHTLDDGVEVAVDGGAGEVTVAPSGALRERIAHRAEARRLLHSASAGPGRLADGTRITLCANVGTVADAVRAAELDVEGVGLFRTEFLFGDRDEAPTVADQVGLYTEVFAAFGARPVTVRTLDIGADKPLPFARQDDEANPALGVRGIRHAARFEDILISQLDAIASAQQATGATVKVMAPMVATAAEAQWFAQRCRDRGLSEVGVMIEVPAAALRSREVLASMDFASIGTNDLTQYVMAADRTNGHVSQLLSAWQPAVLDLVALTVEGAGEVPVGVCGEAAADPLLALVLVGLGVAGLSMAPARVAEVRHALSLHTQAQCEQLAQAARAAHDPDGARAAALALADPAVAELL